MGSRKSEVVAWSVNDLSRIYTTHRAMLVRRAARRVQDSSIAEEIVQEAFLKLMLASPEIVSEDHLLAYLNTTITNLATDHAQRLGVRPRLVAIDSETTAAEVEELSAQANVDFDDALMRADDAAIVREALARLSEADRNLLIASEFEGLSADDVAARYGMSTSTVRSALVRARRNLRVILETWIVDEETGTTAAQMLSRTYAKVAENSKKIGGAALSLVLLVGAFFGFWNNPAPTGQVVAAPNVTADPSVTEAPTVSPSGTVTTESPAVTASEGGVPTAQDLQQKTIEVLSTMGPLGWPGLDAAGVPVGFTVNNGGSNAGEGTLTNASLRFTNSGAIEASTEFITVKDGVNVLLSQKTVYAAGKLTYVAAPMVRVNGEWVDLTIASRSIKITAMADGNFLVTAFYLVDAAASEKSLRSAGIGMGSDVTSIPGVVATRLVVSAAGLPILGQAVQVLAPLAGL